MKTKKLLLMLTFATLIASSESCYSMESTENIGYMQRARNWASNFITRCRYVGTLATIYASLGMYDFKKITGLDEDKLNTYKADQLDQLKNAKERVEIMIEFGGWSKDLDAIFHKVQAQYQQAKSDEEDMEDERKVMKEADLSYDEAEAIELIEQEKIKTQKQQTK